MAVGRGHTAGGTELLSEQRARVGQAPVVLDGPDLLKKCNHFLGCGTSASFLPSVFPTLLHAPVAGLTKGQGHVVPSLSSGPAGSGCLGPMVLDTWTLSDKSCQLPFSEQ